MPRKKRGAVPIKEKEENELLGTLKSIQKRYGKNSVRKASDVYQPNRIPTGIFTLDLCMLGGLSCSRSSLIVGNLHSGKGQRPTDRVLTPDGWTMFMDLEVGDSIIGSEGKPIKITGVFPRGGVESYEVFFTDKSSLIVDKDHLWQVQSVKQAHTTGNHFVKTTEELFNSKLRLYKSKSCKYRIPLVDPVQFSDTKLPIPAYLLGVILANAHIKSVVDIATNDSDVIRYANILLKDTKAHIVERTYGSVRHWKVVDRNRSNKNSTIIKLKLLGLWGKLSRDKFIPEVYLRSSVDNRIALLNGLMDCDGSTTYLENTSKHYAGARYYSYSRKLALDVQELVRSLGGVATISQNYREEDKVYAQNVSIMLPLGISTFKACNKKVKEYEGRKRRGPVKSISHITPVGEKEIICISVDASNGLYVTEDYTVTHNTSLACRIVGNTQRKFPDSKVVWLEIEGAYDSVWAEKLGVQTEQLEYVECTSGEMLVDVADAVLQSKETSLIVVDSIAAMAPMSEKNASAEDNHIGHQARLVTEYVRKSISGMIEERSRGHEVSILNISQFRADIGGYGMNPRRIAGGNALTQSTSFNVIMKNKENKGSDSSGIEVVTHNDHSFTITKNKMNNGPRVGEFTLIREDQPDNNLFVGDVDDSSTVLSIAKKMSFYGGGGQSWRLEFDDINLKFGRAAEAIQALRQDRNLYWKLRTHIIRTQAQKQGMKSEFIKRIV